MYFEHNSVCKNLFLRAFFCWDSGPFLSEMDQKFKSGGTFGYGDSYFEFFFRHSKVFRLHSILHDAAGAVWVHSGKGPAYCYMIERGPNSCLLGHLTGRLFCLFVKLFLPSILTSVDFWSSMSCIVLDKEVADKKRFLKNWVFYFIAKFRDTQFVLQKSTNPQNERFGEQRTCTDLCGTVDVWITVSFQKLFLQL